MIAIRNIETKINQLTLGKIKGLEHYLDYIINTKTASKPRKLRQDWAGGLKKIKSSAIDLQKKALDWRQE